MYPKRNAGTTAATNQKYTLQELAETAHTYPWQELCQTLRKQDKRLRLIDQEKRDVLAQEAELSIWKYFKERPAVLKELKNQVAC